MIFQGSVSSA